MGQLFLDGLSTPLEECCVATMGNTVAMGDVVATGDIVAMGRHNCYE